MTKTMLIILAGSLAAIVLGAVLAGAIAAHLINQREDERIHAAEAARVYQAYIDDLNYMQQAVLREEKRTGGRYQGPVFEEVYRDVVKTAQTVPIGAKGIREVAAGIATTYVQPLPPPRAGGQKAR